MYYGQNTCNPLEENLSSNFSSAFENVVCRLFLFTLFILFIAMTTGLAHAQGQQYTPTSDYNKKSLHGFRILINPDVSKHKDDKEEMLNELDSQLSEIVRVLPSRRLSVVRKVWIWVEWNTKRNGAAEFHPSEVWLRENGYNPAKAGSLELSNTRNFVNWSRSGQPWMILHELSHAYHHLRLGEDHQGIEAAYKQAVEKKLYKSVAYINGGKKRAYALTNAKEYFAELSEAYFGRNDFYPFIRTELEEYDTVGFELMYSVWGKPRNH
jgi:hypothetical protein